MLCTPGEFVKMNQDILQGKSVQSFHSVNEVREMPQNFAKWVDDNRYRIIRAKAVLYFVKDIIGIRALSGLKDKTGEVQGSFTRLYGTGKELDKSHPLYGYTANVLKAQYEEAKMIADKLNLEFTESMQFSIANNGNVNPNYRWWNGLLSMPAYHQNCTITSDILELRLRGINAIAGGLDKLYPKIRKYAKSGDIGTIWIDPKTGKTAIPKTFKAKNTEAISRKLEDITKQEGRYKICVYWKGGNGHSFSAIRTKDDKLYFYDPQNSEVDYTSWIKDVDIKKDIKILRVDNKSINLDAAKGIIKR